MRGALVVLLGLAACGGEPSQRTPVPTGGSSLRADVAPIFERSCMTSSCHSGPVTDEPGSKSVTASRPTAPPFGDLRAGQSGWTLVKPGDPERSYLMARIRNPGGLPPLMPLGGAALDAADKATITRWIARGAPDD